MQRAVELQVGDRLGRYRVLQELGRGAMGLVLLAEDTVLQQRVCLKLLHPELLDHPEANARFTREIVLARRVSHPAVCRVFDLHEVAGVRFLSMEYVEGTPLRAVLGKDAPLLEAERVLRIVRNICRGLQAAHEVGVIHRDLKPRNIMLRTPSGGDIDEVSILDFGIATATDALAPLTQPGVMLGTRLYIAPEVWDGQLATPRSDLFAVGVILFQLLTGRAPWQSEPTNVRGLLEAMQRAPAPRLSTLRTGLPAPLDDLVAAALAVDPARRQTCARAFADGCDRVLAELGDPTVALDLVVTGTLVDAAARSITAVLPAPVTAASHARDDDDTADAHSASWVVGGRAVDLPVRPKQAPPAPRDAPTTPATPAAPAPARSAPRRFKATLAVLVLGGAAGFSFTLVDRAPLAPVVAAAPVADPAAVEDPPAEPEAPAAPAAAVDVAPAAGATDRPAVVDDTPAPVAKPGADEPAVADAQDAAGVVVDAADGDEPATARPRTTKVSRAAALQAEKRLKAATAARGLRPGDDATLDRLRSKGQQRLRRRKYADAQAAFHSAQLRLDAVIIDRAFVDQKLARFNVRYDRVQDAALRQKLDDTATQALQAVGAGRLAEANAALNRGFALLAR